MAQNAKVAQLEPERKRGESLWMDAFKRLRRNRAAMLGLVIIIINVLIAFFAPLLAPRDYKYQVLEENNAAPEWLINLFPSMKAAAQTVALDDFSEWEILVEGAQAVENGQVLARHPELGEVTSIMSGTAYVEGETVNVTKGNIEIYTLDDSWEILLDRFQLLKPVEAGTVIAQSSTGEVIQVEYTAQVAINDNVVRLREQDGGYVTVSNDYPLGADNLGRDMLSRLIFGSRISLAVAFVGPFVSLIVGLAWGLTAGYSGGRVDNIMMRVVDVMYAFPTILLIILLMAFFRTSFSGSANVSDFAAAIGQIDRDTGGILFIFVGIGITSWMGLSRLTRGQVLAVREMEYVEAARAIGVSRWRIVSQHIFPNILGPIIVAETLTIPAYIRYEAFLSFIGLGVNAPTPSWGAMISESSKAIRAYPYQALFPALALFFIMFAFNFLGDGLRDALDPRMRGVD